MKSVIGQTLTWGFAAIGLATILFGGMAMALLAFLLLVRTAAIEVENVKQEQQRNELIERTYHE